MPENVVTFGEIMLRLAPPGFERFLQTPQFVATFGGAEANVAMALASFGLPASFVTVLPDNAIMGLHRSRPEMTRERWLLQLCRRLSVLDHDRRTSIRASSRCGFGH
jgi:hypothetical protein